jgi:phenylalanyl-tRNA synthetase beta chain
MKISLNWLQDYVELTETNIDTIVSTLTEKAAEVEGYVDQKQQYQKIVIGEIKSLESHPNADKLQLAFTEVTPGEVHQIVCGASNIKAGQKVPVALEGAVITGQGESFVIKKSKIRGQESNGMLCSKKELGISDDHQGIYILDPDLTIGASFAESLGLNDIIIEIDNTAITNRPDLFSLLGFAREFVACNLAKWKKGNPDVLSADSLQSRLPLADQNLSFNLTIEKAEICPRWCGLEIANVTVASSPSWLQKRLIACDIRPINNIVDVTNYVMLELGMPMHAFDSDKIAGKNLHMRESKAGETITTLDDKEHQLPPKAIVMEDEKEIFDLCGLMGGASSMVSETTVNLLVHAPIYEPVRIRRAALALNQRTDAAVIYEKSVPQIMALPGLLRTCELILEVAPGAQIKTNYLDLWPNPEPERELGLSLAMIKRVLGFELENSELANIFERLGFGYTQKLDNWKITVPQQRYGDIRIAEDLLEEIVRIYGLNQIDPRPPEFAVRLNQKPSSFRIREQLLEHFARFDFQEVINYSFLGADLLKRAGFSAKSSSYIYLANPLSQDLAIMRTSLLPRILEVAEQNRRYQEEFSLVEIGKVFFRNQEQQKSEKLMLGALQLGGDFFELKGLVESLFTSLSQKFKFKTAADHLQITLNKQQVGYLQVLSATVCQQFDLSQDSFYLELDLEHFSQIAKKPQQYKPLARYPEVNYDLAILAPDDQPAAKILKMLENIDKLIVKSTIMEVFAGQGVPEGQKSITLSFTFRAADRTLNAEDIKNLEQKIAKTLKRNNLQKRF